MMKIGAYHSVKSRSWWDKKPIGVLFLATLRVKYLDFFTSAFSLKARGKLSLPYLLESMG